MTRFAELRQRLFFLLGALVVYRIGTFIPAPGIDPIALARFFQQQQGTILDIFNMFNRANFGLPDTNVVSATAGVISTLGGDPRIMQLSARFAF